MTNNSDLLSSENSFISSWQISLLRSTFWNCNANSIVTPAVCFDLHWLCAGHYANSCYQLFNTCNDEAKCCICWWTAWASGQQPMYLFPCVCCQLWTCLFLAPEYFSLHKLLYQYLTDTYLTNQITINCKYPLPWSIGKIILIHNIYWNLETVSIRWSSRRDSSYFIKIMCQFTCIHSVVRLENNVLINHSLKTKVETSSELN